MQPRDFTSFYSLRDTAASWWMYPQAISYYSTWRVVKLFPSPSWTKSLELRFTVERWKNMAEFFAGKQLKTKTLDLVSASEALKGKEVVVLYFSAHWCPPCRGFTPKLKDFYEEVIKGGGSLAVIFVSSDGSEEDMNKYIEEDHGDWFAVPFGDEAVNSLKKKCNVSGIPKLVVVNAKGEPIHGEARGDVQGGSPMATYNKWLKLNWTLNCSKVTDTDYKLRVVS